MLAWLIVHIRGKRMPLKNLTAEKNTEAHSA